MRLPTSAGLLLMTALGCSHSAPPPPVPGDPEGPPSLQALPDVDQGMFDVAMRQAWELADEAFVLAAPPPPEEGADLPTIQAYSRGPMQAWVEQKSRRITMARRELDRAAETSRVQRVLAGAVVGMLYEDLARGLLAVPVPAEFAETDPEAAAAYRYVVEAEAQPALEFARRAYGACTANSRDDEELRDWARFCSERRALLPLTQRDMNESGGTVVDVIVE